MALYVPHHLQRQRAQQSLLKRAKMRKIEAELRKEALQKKRKRKKLPERYGERSAS